MTFNQKSICDQFPVLRRTVHGKRLVYLDNAATTLKPKSVIEAINHYNSEGTANIHRGVHLLSEEATDKFEKSRVAMAKFVNAPTQNEIVFTSGSTMSLNIIALGWGGAFVGKDDEIILSRLEHHSNIVPWQLLAQRVGCRIRVIPINDRGELNLSVFRELLNPRTKIVSVSAVSNALGTINPIEEICHEARKIGALSIIDGSQAMSHTPVDVQKIGCDFLVFSGHKMYAETGSGGFYGRKECLEKMPPVFGGGDMIRSVSFEKTTFAPPPFKFEAGTPNISGVLSLTPAINFINEVGFSAIQRHEHELLEYGTETLSRINGLKWIGQAEHRAGVLSFVLEGIHPHDLGTLLDQEGVAIRTGHHCAQPVMQYFKVPATARASLAIYNTREDIDALAYALRKAQEVFA